MPGRYEMWAWLLEDEHGTERVIAIGIDQRRSPVALQSPRREIAEKLRPVAELHGQAAGRPVRLAHLVEERSAG